MKVVIGTSIYGFELSQDAIQKYAKKKGIELYRKYDIDFGYYSYYTDENMENEYYINTYSLEFRCDKDLIDVVEELKNSVELKVVEIPDGIEFDIGMPDYGKEWIFEKHRTWS